MKNINSFNSEDIIEINNQKFKYFDLNKAAKHFEVNLNKIPISIKIIIENLLRNEDGENVTKDMISEVFSSLKKINQKEEKIEISFFPTRVLMQDFTGVPAVADLAAMRNALKAKGIEPKKINPLSRVDLVIDHSVIADFHGTEDALQQNVALEYERNGERYSFLKWAAQAFKNVRIVPPGAGILHQVNIEYIANVVTGREINGELCAIPDSLLGMDSHTTMVNGISVFGWGVGGLEGGTAMLGQPISMLIPDVVGCKLIGELGPASTPTDVAFFCLLQQQMLTILDVLQRE